MALLSGRNIDSTGNQPILLSYSFTSGENRPFENESILLKKGSPYSVIFDEENGFLKSASFHLNEKLKSYFLAQGVT